MTTLIATAVLVVSAFLSIFITERITEKLREYLEKPLKEKVERVFDETDPKCQSTLEIFFGEGGKKVLFRSLFEKPKDKRETYEQSYVDRARQFTLDKPYFDKLESEGPKKSLVLFKFVPFAMYFTLTPAIFILLAVMVDRPFDYFQDLETLAASRAADTEIYESLNSLDKSITALQSDSISISDIRTVGSEIAAKTVKLQELIEARTEANALLSENLRKREAEANLLLEEVNLLQVQSEEQLGMKSSLV